MKTFRILGLVLLLALAVSTTRSVGAVIAYNIASGMNGNQGWGGVLGMDFDVEHAINVTALGAFDSGSNGILGTTITTELWSRNRGFALGTSQADYNDDSAIAILASTTFTGTEGTLIGGSRFKDIPGGLVLEPGAYTIVAYGYSGSEFNGNLGVAGAFTGSTVNDGGGSISFVGFSRAGGTPGVSIGGPLADNGPANRYGAGTFQFEAVDPLPAPVALQNAAALYSQGGFPIGAAINGVMNPNPLAVDGWANSGYGANTAVFETVADLGFEEGTDLTFKISSGGFGTGSHTLGKFRLSVTTDDRSTFADGLANSGDVTANWIPLDVREISSNNGNIATGVNSNNTTFTKLPDLSLLASGAVHENAVETYTLTAATYLTGITGIRLEALTDPSLPGANFGPGRAANGNYVMRELSLTAEPTLGEIPLRNATAFFSQGGFEVARAIDGAVEAGVAENATRGWANHANGPNAAVFETTVDVGFEEGTRLTFDLISGGFGLGNHTPGRFRIAVTTDDRATFADGLATGGDVEANWTVLDPSTYVSDNGGVAGNVTTLTELPDHSLLASGPQVPGAVETYTITALTDLMGITGIRLEMLTDPSLPLNTGGFNGPGRSTSGNYVLREVRFFAAPVPEPATWILLAAGLAALAAARRRRLP